eukprot:68947-Pleurochrysis_carterae.AAC.1
MIANDCEKHNHQFGDGSYLPQIDDCFPAIHVDSLLRYSRMNSFLIYAGNKMPSRPMMAERAWAGEWTCVRVRKRESARA